MSLLKHVTEKTPIKSPIITIYGGPGSRKTQFGIDMPSPIFAAFEDGFGTRQVPHLKMREIEAEEGGLRNGYLATLDLIKDLATTDHGYKTLVIDSADHLTPVIDDYICARDQKASIEAYGYGKGFDAQANEWLKLMHYIERLRNKTNMNVVIIAHASVRNVSDPMQIDGYDRWEPKLPKKACAILKELSDVVGFSMQKFTLTENEQGKTKAVGKGDYILRMSPSPCYEAKNRYHLADMEMSAKAFLSAFNATTSQP